MADRRDFSADDSIAKKPSRTDEIVEQWFNEQIKGSVAGTNTETYNHIYSAAQDLKARLRNG